MRCIYGGIRESRIRPRWSWVSQSNTLPVCAGTDGHFVPPRCACKCGGPAFAYMAVPVNAVRAALHHLTEASVTVLSTSIRQSGDAAFADIVTGVGDGAGIADGDGQWRGWWRVPTCIQVFDDPDEAREWVFEGANTPYERAQRALLAPRNEDVDAHNHAFVHALDGDIVRLCGHEHRDDERPAARGYDNNRGSRLLSETFMAVMKRPGVPPHVLQLKVGCICMCMRNLDPELGLLNGTKLRILRLGLRVIEAEILRVNATGAVFDSSNQLHDAYPAGQCHHPTSSIPAAPCVRHDGEQIPRANASPCRRGLEVTMLRPWAVVCGAVACAKRGRRAFPA